MTRRANLGLRWVQDEYPDSFYHLREYGVHFPRGVPNGWVPQRGYPSYILGFVPDSSLDIDDWGWLKFAISRSGAVYRIGDEWTVEPDPVWRPGRR